jgi:hypothetical protein
MEIGNYNSPLKYSYGYADNNIDGSDYGYIKDAGMRDTTEITIANGKDSVMAAIESQKAFYVVDENNNVFIKIVDPDGDVVKQIPSQEYITMSKNMDETNKCLFHVEV